MRLETVPFPRVDISGLPASGRWGKNGLNLEASYINLRSRASWGFIYRPYHVTIVGPSWARKLGGKLHDSLRWLGCNALMTNAQLNIHTHKKYEIINVTDMWVLRGDTSIHPIRMGSFGTTKFPQYLHQALSNSVLSAVVTGDSGGWDDLPAGSDHDRSVSTSSK